MAPLRNNRNALQNEAVVSPDMTAFDNGAVRTTDTTGRTDTDRTEAGSDIWLKREPDGLVLTDGHLSLKPDFSHLLKRIQPNRLSRELLVRAARIKHATGQLTAVDATAGLGEDAFLLAAAGFEVELYESDPVVFALLDDALQRANHDDRMASVASRMHAHHQDSIETLTHMTASPTVVYLDPMFPERQKAAAVKKKFQLIHQLERPCADEQDLLAAALSACPQKVVIKRPLKGPFLANVKPAYTLSGKAVRYDVLLPAQMSRSR